MSALRLNILKKSLSNLRTRTLSNTFVRTPVRYQASAAAMPKPVEQDQSPVTTKSPTPSPKQPSSSRTSDNPENLIGLTGGQIFHQMMLEHDVKHVFGYPGGAILPVYDAIYNSDQFELVLPRHEQGAGHMAEGYARATGKPGVVLVTSGPGATNIITPMQDALSDGVPMVVFCGQVPTSAIGTDAFQEADIVGISRSCSKWNVLVKDIRELPRRINEAFYIATSGRPGPVLVDLPKDVTASTLRSALTSQPNLPSPVIAKLASQLYPHKDLGTTLNKVSDMINKAQKPVLYVGNGILSSPEGPKLLKELAERADIPVTTTLQALGAFDEHDRKSLHMLGMHGSAYANLAMQNSDLIIALGARFDDRVIGNVKMFAPAARKAEAEGRGGIVHFDILPKNINKTVKVTEGVEGDVITNLKYLLPTIKKAQHSQWFAKIDQWKQKYPFTYCKDNAPAGTMKPQFVIEELDRQIEAIKENVIITTGVGQHQMWAAQYIRWRQPRSFISSGGLGTMGFGIPSAIGAKVGQPDKMVIDIDGDASFCMTAMELATAAQFNIGVKILLLNNDFQGMVKQWQDLFYEERYSSTRMYNPDFVKLSEAMGVRGLRCSDAAELPKVMAEFLAHPGPVVLEAKVDKAEHVYPMVPAGKANHEMVLNDTLSLEEVHDF
ncbi:acetolactate synthase [Conidiobolus coronatus NRRL 28638]|uniref:Acetolactate synthase n=1 Tax=Conidiobolus coronatus (strain ATCC 28846 / CBS 209.66 / NRRL 28638) TaxID=796925 RepID=A0A137P2F1_CONC2|nr:acetolactate synthase [Conidiobolus coronatus NRRL 28638]|eukprot:KXN69091.1 acetolactate synthase [Conidiobolus coronatus NRRL 28638]